MKGSENFYLVLLFLFSFISTAISDQKSCWMEFKGTAIGIDLGTTYSCVGIWLTQQQRVEIITNDQGNRTTPSYVAFTNTERFIGEAAKNQVAGNPVNSLFGMSSVSNSSAVLSNAYVSIVWSCYPRKILYLFYNHIHFLD